MAEGHSAKVTIEGDSSSFERAAARAAQSSRKVTDAVTQTGTAHQRAEQAISRSTGALAKHDQAQVRMQKATERVGFALHQVVGQTASFNQALQGVLGTFGGWGVAIGALVGVVLHFAEAEEEARKKAVKLNDELRKQAGLRREALAEDASNALIRRQTLAEERRQKALEKERKQVEINALEEKRGLEEAITIAESRGQKAEGFLRRQAELQAEVLEKQAKFAEGEEQLAILRERDAVLHEEKLRRLEVEGRREKELTENKKKQLTLAEQLAKINAEAMKRTPFGNSPSFGRTGQDTLFDIEAGSQRPANNRPGLSLSGAPAIMRDPNAAVTVEQQRNASLRAIEVERAQELEFDLQAELSRIEREKQAQLGLLEFNERVAANDAERLAIREERRQAAHDAELARIEAEKVARTKAQESIANAIETTGGIIGAGTKLAAMAAEATGASAKKQARVAQVGLGIQAMAIGALEVVKAAAAYASLNIPQGIAHTAAAAVAFTEGGLLLAGKIGGSGGGASVGGGGGRPTGDTTPRQSTVSTAGSDSQIPGSPGPSAPRVGGGSSNSGGGAMIVDLRGANFYGTGGKKEFGRFLDESLLEAEQNRRPRRSTG